jgi:hypothetical protein
MMALGIAFLLCCAWMAYEIEHAPQREDFN